MFLIDRVGMYGKEVWLVMTNSSRTWLVRTNSAGNLDLGCSWTSMHLGFGKLMHSDVVGQDMCNNSV